MNIVVVSSTGGRKQVQKVRLDEDRAITVGRAWQNDIVLDDEYVDPEPVSYTHLTLPTIYSV